jgi:hypothetical protein
MGLQEGIVRLPNAGVLQAGGDTAACPFSLFLTDLLRVSGHSWSETHSWLLAIHRRGVKDDAARRRSLPAMHRN